jgi:Ca2+-binding EF-hand superfamily protein
MLELFQDCDTHFRGRVKYDTVMKVMMKNSNLVALIGKYKYSKQWAKRAVTFRELLIHLFGRSHAKNLHQILKWSKQPKPSLLTAEQKDSIRRLYQDYDSDQDGRITLSEVRRHLKTNGFTKHDGDELFAHFDGDGDDTVTYQEFEMFYTAAW